MTKKQRKYSKEILESVVKESLSISEVARRLGIPDRGGNRKTIKSKIKQFGIDCSHFTGQAWARGQTADSSEPIRRMRTKLSYSNDEIFIQNSKYLGGGSRLAPRLRSLGWNYVCQECGLSEWRGKELTLHLDHINGMPDDHRLENLRFLCPNCHQQTQTWGNKRRDGYYSPPLLIQNSQIILSTQVNHLAVNDPSKVCFKLQSINCSYCAKPLTTSNQHTYCSRQCFNLASRRIVRPAKEELEKMIWTQPTTHIARNFGVSDKAVEKWCKAYGIEKPPRGYWAKLNSKNTGL